MKNSEKIKMQQVSCQSTLENSVTVFVGGPIQYAIESGEFDSQLRENLINVITYLKSKGLRVLSAHEAEEYGKIDMTGMANEVTNRDFMWMQQSDVYLCIFPMGEDKKPYRSDGTCIELGWASALKKKIIFVRSNDLVYSHLIEGLESVANVSYVDIDVLAKSPQYVLNKVF